MRLFNNSFLCLDIGTYSVRGIAYKLYGNKIIESSEFSYRSNDITFAIKKVADELDKKLNTHFNNAYVTGNFGEIFFSIKTLTNNFEKEHLIKDTDILNQIDLLIKDMFYYPIHIIPFRYDITSLKNIKSPIGYYTRSLTSLFSCIYYKTEELKKIEFYLRKSHIMVLSYFDSHFLQNYLQKSKYSFFIEFGFNYTTVSIWINSVPLFYKQFSMAQKNIHEALKENFNLTDIETENINHDISNVEITDTDRFIPASINSEFSKYDFNEIIYSYLSNILINIKTEVSDLIEKYNITKIYISGGGSRISNIEKMIENIFKLEIIKSGDRANIISLSEYILNNKLNKKESFIQKSINNIINSVSKIFTKQKKQECPIIPNICSFNIKSTNTYKMFKNAGITRINIEISDGLFINKKSGSLSDIKYIIVNSKLKLSVHCMTEAPFYWIKEIVKYKIDTIIIPIDTFDIKVNIKTIISNGIKCGISLYTNSDIKNIIPFIKYLNEIVLMIEDNNDQNEIIEKIRLLNFIRNKYNLKYKIIISGKVNEKNSFKYFSEQVDYLISGSYLSKSFDFSLAVQTLIGK